MEGFFSPAKLQMAKQPASLLPKCGLCKLSQSCRSPKMAPHGSNRRDVMIVGEMPMRMEDTAGRPFVGDAGQLLSRTLRKFGVDMHKDCVLTNALSCAPEGGIIKDKRAIEFCRPLVLRAIEQYQPKVIILLGSTAVKSVIGHLWKDDVGGIKRWAGFRIPCRDPNAWVCPTYHPSFVLRADQRNRPLYEMVFERHLRAAFEKTERPWEEIPDYAKEVDVILDAGKAARIIRRMVERGGTVAVDYETNSLKPDGEHARIVCCSVCWEGKKTIAYPWQGEAIIATKELWLSPLRKVAANCKFEDRWTRAKLGIEVKNWHWDTMVQAHVIDSRARISGLKFQAFCTLGQTDYDGHIKPYLKSKGGGGNDENRIRELDISDLCLYNGLDSLLEYRIAEIQKKIIGVA